MGLGIVSSSLVTCLQRFKFLLLPHFWIRQPFRLVASGPHFVYQLIREQIPCVARVIQFECLREPPEVNRDGVFRSKCRDQRILRTDRIVQGVLEQTKLNAIDRDWLSDIYSITGE